MTPRAPLIPHLPPTPSVSAADAVPPTLPADAVRRAPFAVRGESSSDDPTPRCPCDEDLALPGEALTLATRGHREGAGEGGSRCTQNNR